MLPFKGIKNIATEVIEQNDIGDQDRKAWEKRLLENSDFSFLAILQCSAFGSSFV